MARSSVLAGVVCGLAWASALPVVAVEVAGPPADGGWIGIAAALALGALVGGLLGRAAHRRAGGRWAWWGRTALAALALLAVPAWLAVAVRTGLAPDTPRGAWLAVLVVSLVAVLCLGCAVPLRDGAPVTRPGLWLVAAGAVCGVAWSAALRGFMAVAAGAESTVSWLGTFGFILIPGAVVGGLLGGAEHRRRSGREPGRLALAPLVFALDPAALVLVLPAMAGGWVLAGRGSPRARWVAGVAAFLPVPIYVLAVLLLDDVRSLATPSGATNTVLLFSCTAVLALACAAPRRAVAAPGVSSGARQRFDVGVPG